MEPLTKDEISRQMVAFYLEHLFVLFLITMGGGKTKGSLDCVITRFGYKRKGIIICNTAKARDKTWPAEIKQWHPQLQEAIDKNFVKLVHKDHVCKLHPDWYDWIIWDEVHLAKREHLAWIKMSVFKTIILMTGTETSDDFMKRNVRKLVNQAVLEFPTEEGIDRKLINDYRIKTIEVTMNELDYEGYMDIAKKLTIARNSGNSEWLQAMINQRYTFLYSRTDKIEVIKRLDEHLQDKRRLLFMATKEACSEVSEYIFHSSTNEEHFLLFARGDINKLASIRQLKTGTNIKGFDHLLLQQINSKYEDFMQTLGRLLRLEIGQIGWIYILYFKETQDQSWFFKASREIPSHKIRTYDLSKISMEEIVNDKF